VHIDEVLVSAAFRSLDESEQWIIDVGGPVAIVTRRLPAQGRDALSAQPARAPEHFAADDGASFPARPCARWRAEPDVTPPMTCDETTYSRGPRLGPQRLP
jgi:hypothetical protein